MKLAIEIDGDSHFLDGATEYDQARQEFMESVGIKFIRFTNNEVYGNLSGVLESIVQHIQDLRTSPPAPLLIKERGYDYYINIVKNDETLSPNTYPRMW